MKKIFFLMVACFCLLSPCGAQETKLAKDKSLKKVLIQTSMGDIVICLYNETPQHRDNFLKLVKKKAYNGVLFHRVIKDFMIQGGDMSSKNAVKGQELGDGKETYSIPAEIRFPQLFHKKGVVAAAREGDTVNPQRASSSSQFYIVVGKKMTDAMLDQVQQRILRATNGTAKLTPAQREVYRTIGGTPHLDGQYTVFGEVLKGMDVVEKIQEVETDKNDRPIEDVKILKTKIIKKVKL